MASTMKNCQMLIDVYRGIINYLLSFCIDETTYAISGFESVRIARNVYDARKCSMLTDDQLRGVMLALHDGMEKGLRKGTPPGIGLKMLPSYVRAIANGTEYGDFLALDLGGTNFRVLLIRLRGTGAELCGKICDIPSAIQRGTGEALFDHVAHCIVLFTEEQFGDKKKKLPLGFTFSFATQIKGLTKGKLIHLYLRPQSFSI